MNRWYLPCNPRMWMLRNENPQQALRKPCTVDSSVITKIVALWLSDSNFFFSFSFCLAVFEEIFSVYLLRRSKNMLQLWRNIMRWEEKKNLKVNRLPVWEGSLVCVETNIIFSFSSFSFVRISTSVLLSIGSFQSEAEGTRGCTNASLETKSPAERWELLTKSKRERERKRKRKKKRKN